jgi:hypothetical protein
VATWLLSEVRQVRDALPSLQELHIPIATVDPPLMHLVPELVVFPSSLTTLHLSFYNSNNFHFSSPLVAQLPVCCHALTSLTLCCNECMVLDPLLLLETPLHCLRLGRSGVLYGNKLSGPQIDVLKQLRHLRELDCSSCGFSIPAALVRADAERARASVVGVCGLSAVHVKVACMRALANLPSLTFL